MDPNNFLDNEIPAETVVLTSKRQIQQMQMKKHREKRILKLFICHILDDSKIQPSSEKENYYCMGKMIFKKIQVRGIITSVNVHKNETHTFLVDDGTGTLDCFLFKNEPLEDFRNKTIESIEDNTSLLNQENSPAHRASLMMLQNTREQLKQFVSYSDFTLGDTVELIGKLNEYHAKRNCVVQSIRKVDPIFNSSYYEELDHLYRTVYLSYSIGT